MYRPFITLTSDFGVQSQGVGIMEAVILSISSDAHVIHLMHGLPDYDITAGARTLETVKSLPVGYHICVVDPGVGTKRKGLIIKTKRGDYLIGPDNGVLIPAATQILGGCEKVVTIENPKYMRQPVSPIFHGRDVFSPAAAYLSIGVPQGEFGTEINSNQLTPAPYQECVIKNNAIEAQVISINKYGSPQLNILQDTWDTLGVQLGESVQLDFSSHHLELPFVETFGMVSPKTLLILKDDYGRISASVNRGNFAQMYNVKPGDRCTIKKL